VEGRDIGDAETLADIADGAGMDAAVVLRLLASDADLEETRAKDVSARDMGVTSVPTFIVDGKHAVPGAQPAELWLRVIDEIAQKQATP
jgi:predicted DsbA family dithiol-disulfide isomerase